MLTNLCRPVLGLSRHCGPDIKLVKDVPQVGLGLWKVTNSGEFEQTFAAAIESGYRHFDTAQAMVTKRCWAMHGRRRI
jgi:hypothetical protein